MKIFGCGIIFMLVVTALTSAGQQPPPAQPGREPSWAFHAINGAVPAEDPGPKNLSGSSKSYTPAQIDDLLNPPDWFPDEHPPAPSIVQKGHAGALACGACHLMSGEGHPESAGMTGFTADYIVRQMTDFKSGARKDAARMNAIAKELSDEEIRQAADWFAKLKPTGWTKVTEAATVPKTFVGQGRMRFVQPGGEMEPIGNRIITVPQDQTKARLRDPHSGFIAYVPVGSIAKGKTLVETGGSGKTIACSTCHGDGLKGLGNVPRLAGLHPIYVARQLYLFKDGSRNGGDAQLMKKPVANLTDDDILALSAYVGSLAP
ncbi:MAG: cytochrome C [Blastocatellia bacterium]|nr:MAG: cytochrome C [Blastocatellia bacterium]